MFDRAFARAISVFDRVFARDVRSIMHACVLYVQSCVRVRVIGGTNKNASLENHLYTNLIEQAYIDTFLFTSPARVSSFYSSISCW